MAPRWATGLVILIGWVLCAPHARGDDERAASNERARRELRRLAATVRGLRDATKGRKLPASLEEVWNAPLIPPRVRAALPRSDPWGRPYAYTPQGRRKFELRSLGPDGRRGTPDDRVEDYRDEEAVLRIVRTAERLELFSVHSFRYRSLASPTKDAGSYVDMATAALEEDEALYGSVVIAEAAARKEVARLLTKAVEEPFFAASCYQPRHVLLATKGTERAVVHLCFQCNRVILLGPRTEHPRQQALSRAPELKALLTRLLQGRLAGREAGMKHPLEPEPPEGGALRDVLPVGILDEAERVELYALDPAVYADLAFRSDARTRPLEALIRALRAGTGVLGHTPLLRAWTRRRVTNAVYAGWLRGDDAKCFEPRHALHVQRGTEEAVILLSFTCDQAVVLEGRTKHARLTPFGDRRDLEKLLNRILRRRGIRLVK